MYYLANIPEIKIKSDVLFQLGPVMVTDSMMGMLVVNLVLIALIVWFRSGAGLIPSRVQVALESVLSFFVDTLSSAFGSEKEARKIFPLIATLFLVLLVANQFSVIPLISELTANGGEVGVFRVPSSDFSLTIALAVFVVGLTHLIALRISPLRHIGNFIKIAPLFKARSLVAFFDAVLGFFLGLLDIVGEIAKIVSLSARLFGNIFAGELMVLIITYLASFTNYIIPIPFMFLSMFGGLVHAFVFPLLSIQYMAGTISSVKSETPVAEKKEVTA